MKNMISGCLWEEAAIYEKTGKKAFVMWYYKLEIKLTLL